MPKHDMDIEDEGLRGLFSALDEIRASEELKEKTLDAILSVRHEGSEKPQLAVMEGGRARTGRPRGLRVLGRIAAIVIAFAVAGGGVAYALPSSYVTVSSGGTTIELGVNVFGVTVGAIADTDEGMELLEGLELRGKGYEDAMELVAEGFDEQGADEAGLDIRIHGGSPSQRKSMDEAAERVMENRAPTSDDPAEQGSGPLDAPDAQSGESGSGMQGNAPGHGAVRPEQPAAQPDADGVGQQDALQAPIDGGEAAGGAFQEGGRP